jgi:hypothetical protein
MRDFKKPIFKTAQYWGLVKMLQPFVKYSPINTNDKIAFIEGVCAYLKADNEKFNETTFLKALNEGV